MCTAAHVTPLCVAVANQAPSRPGVPNGYRMHRVSRVITVCNGTSGIWLCKQGDAEADQSQYIEFRRHLDEYADRLAPSIDSSPSSAI